MHCDATGIDVSGCCTWICLDASEDPFLVFGSRRWYTRLEERCCISVLFWGADTGALHRVQLTIGSLSGYIGGIEVVLAFGFRIVLFSYQWLSWNQPGPNNIQMGVDADCSRSVLRRNCRSMEKTYVWSDIFSIPHFHGSHFCLLNSEYALPQLG